jgi:hypothetical protein
MFASWCAAEGYDQILTRCAVQHISKHLMQHGAANQKVLQFAVYE